MSGEAAPLRGLRVLVTRRAEQAKDLVDGLAALGANVTAIPLIETLPPDDPGPLRAALARLSRYDWVAFTSANAVRAIHRCMDELRLVIPESLRIASVGRATSEACVSLLGRAPEMEPGSEFRAEGLVAAFAARGAPPTSVLLPVSDRAQDVLEGGLRALGSEVDRVVAYRTATTSESVKRLRDILEMGLDLVVFASPSAVAGFVEAVGDAGRAVPVAAIGPTTGAAATAAGFLVRITAWPSTTEGLLQAIANAPP